MMHFGKISELDQADGFPPPEHPSFSLNQIANSSNALTNMEITCDFYIVCLKKLKSGVILYGKTRYDHDMGSMFFMKPSQILAVQDVQLKEKGLPTVNHMASQLHLSPKYFSDLLKRETGKTALELIHLYVISEAKNMLVVGDRSISEIGYHLGFETPPYFSRLFKKEVGMSPKEHKNHPLN